MLSETNKTTARQRAERQGANMLYEIFVYSNGSADVYDDDDNIIYCCQSVLEAEDWLLNVQMNDDDDYTFAYED